MAAPYKIPLFVGQTAADMITMRFNDLINQINLGFGTVGTLIPFAGSSTVALLPAGIDQQIAYATNGRKIGEGAAAGTGVYVYFSSGQWRVFSDDAPVRS